MWQRAKIISLKPDWAFGKLIWVKMGQPEIKECIHYITRERLAACAVFATNLLDDNNETNKTVLIRPRVCELLGEFAEDGDVELVSLRYFEKLAKQSN